MSASPGSIFKFKEFNDKDKAYTVRLGAGIIGGLLAGVVSGFLYISNASPFWVSTSGWAIFFAQSFGVAYLTMKIYDLSPWTYVRVWRHAVFMNFMMFLYFWVLPFNFIIVNYI